MAWWSSKSRRVKVFTVAVATAAAIAAAHVGLSVGIAGAHVDRFRVRVTTDKQVYEHGDAVEATLRVCRASLVPTTTTGGGGTLLPVEFRVLDNDGNVVADSSHQVRTLELRTAHWLAGQCRWAHLRWDQRYWNRPGVDPPNDVRGLPARGQTVPAGQYKFEVRWKNATEAKTFETEARRDRQ